MSLLDHERLNNLTHQLSQCLQLDGDVIEVGVFKGGSLQRICETTKTHNKNVFGYDTFEGLPQPEKDKDTHSKGDFKSDYDIVKDLFAKYKNCKLIKGEFPDSILDHQAICFAHVDVDLYHCVLNALEKIWNLLSINGIIVIDDYAAQGCPGARTAVHEFLGKTEIANSSLILTRVQCQLTIQKLLPNSPGHW